MKTEPVSDGNSLRKKISLPHLAKLQQLERLIVHGDGITDAGLHHLHGMINLRRLDLSDTSVDKHGAAAAQLQQVLSNCTIRLPLTKSEKAMEQRFRDQKLSFRQ